MARLGRKQKAEALKDLELIIYEMGDAMRSANKRWMVDGVRTQKQLSAWAKYRDWCKAHQEHGL